MTLRESAAQARLLVFWRHTPVGTRVTARRDNGRRIQTTTLGEAFRTESGLAVIRLQAVPGNYPLDHVSFGWTQEPMAAPAVSIATALDPVPRQPDPAGVKFELLFTLAAVAYAATVGLLAVLAAVLP